VFSSLSAFSFSHKAKAAMKNTSVTHFIAASKLKPKVLVDNKLKGSNRNKEHPAPVKSDSFN
jgi:hypothetical protein